MSSITKLSYSVYGDARWNGDNFAYAAFASTFHLEERWHHETLFGGMYSPHNSIETFGRIAELHAVRNALRDAVGRCKEIQQRTPDCSLKVLVYTATAGAFTCVDKLLKARRARGEGEVDLTVVGDHYRVEAKEIVQFIDEIDKLGARFTVIYLPKEPNLIALRYVNEKLEKLKDGNFPW